MNVFLNNVGLTSQPTAAPSIPIHLVTEADWPAWQEKLLPTQRSWTDGHRFKGEGGEACLLPGPDGQLAMVLQGVGKGVRLWSLASLPAQLPAATYHLSDESLSVDLLSQLALGWLLGGYRYRGLPSKTPAPEVLLALPAGIDQQACLQQASACALVRDLITTPANLMGPEQLLAEAEGLAERFGGTVSAVTGEALEQQFPLVHTVGKASSRPPQLITLNWQSPDAPADALLVALVGKGVCFDTGGLDIKSRKSMYHMKNDMGGAASVLGLAQMVMAAKLPIRLLVVIPAVENAIAGNAMRPLDVIKSRSGQTVEIQDTDAEGRLILADALHFAGEQQPQLLIDFATLTYSAFDALGGEIGVFLSNDDPLSDVLLQAATATEDPLWRLPLWQDYAEQLESQTADLLSCGESGVGDAIVAGLFLEKFVPNGLSWLHFDVPGWITSDRPGRPKGGYESGLRAVFHLLRQRFG
jgi:leucyl aminopeptidase